MLGNLSNRFNDALRKMSGRGKISESNVREAMEDVRTALLEADVHYEVVETFCASVTQKAVGEEVLTSLKPGQQMIKIVYDELVELMGAEETAGPPLMQVTPGPTIIMMCGLQGSGKTTTCGKLATYLKKKNIDCMLCAADLQRPAAVDQLETLVDQVNATEVGGSGKVHFYCERDKIAEYGKAVGAAVTVCRNAVRAAQQEKLDYVILDTAGRLHINDALMGELRKVNQAVQPHQIFLVIDAMTGQDAVNSAKAFNDQLEIDGVIITKFDSDTRGGAALSVRHITGAPIKFTGTGEKLDALEEFHADRVASRILGMGDVVSLVERAQEQVSEEEALALQEKIAAGKLSMDDFLKQLKMIRKMGSMKSLLGMLPGIGNALQDIDMDEKEIDRTEAIIKSMTTGEREDIEVLDQSRRRRISRGSGTDVQDVSRLVKGFNMVAQMSQQMSGMGMMSRMKAMAGLGSPEMLAALSGGRGTKAPKLAGGGRPKRKKFKQKRRR
jgi:signal recognition particle subunit SRP54